MREIKTQIRQRTRVLGQREADVIGWAHELRRGEMQLVKREQIMADLVDQQSTVDDFLFDFEYEEHPPEKHQRRRQNENREPMKKTLPDIRDDSNPPRKKVARKRRRRSPRDGRPSTPNEVNIEQTSMRASFGESIPTIVEETPADEQEDSTVEEVFKEAKASESAANNADTVNNERKSSNIVPTDIHKARQQLGISKSKKNERRTSSNRIQHDNNTAETRIETRRISQAPSPKKRHVFTFERRESQITHNLHSGSKSHNLPGMGDGRGRIKATPTRERKEPRASHEKHDDWISSFDSQMKCAMNRLKDLV